MRAVVYAFSQSERIANRIGAHLGIDVSSVALHRFPDGEARVRLPRSVADTTVVLTVSLDRPDEKILPLLFAAATARDLGAGAVGLVAPYLAYMRQDQQFEPGEGVSARHFARLLSGAFDWLVTVDPHLHRARLEELYDIPTRNVASAPLLADWIRAHVVRPVIIGPDSESAQWVENVAARIRAPHVTLRKRRSGDTSVAITLPDLGAALGHQPVLLDDIIASGATMIEATRLLRAAGWPAPVCLGVHAVFAGSAHGALLASGAARVVTSNTILHPSNAIDLSPPIAEAVAELVDRDRVLQPGGINVTQTSAL